MSVWRRITEALNALSSGESLSNVFSYLRTPPEKTVGFTIAVVALGAKMAKADGFVTRDEVRAFREVFTISPAEEENTAKVFNLARADVAGFEQYAQKIAKMFGPSDPRLYDLLEGLFCIATADGFYHPAENEFLNKVAQIFGISESCLTSLRARFVEDADPDPFHVLGLQPGADFEEVRKAWRQAVRESHPDQLLARGVPEEAIKLAEKRLIDVNRAWELLRAGKS